MAAVSLPLLNLSLSKASQQAGRQIKVTGLEHCRGSVGSHPGPAEECLQDGNHKGSLIQHHDPNERSFAQEKCALISAPDVCLAQGTLPSQDSDLFHHGEGLTFQGGLDGQ